MLLDISIIPQTSEELFYFVTKRIPYLCGFWRFANAYNSYSCKELVDHYTSAKFILRRLGNGLIAPERAIEYFSANHISSVALAFIATHSLLEKEALAVSEIMKKNGKREGN